MRVRSVVPLRSMGAALVVGLSLVGLSGCGGGTSTSTTTVAAQAVVLQVTSPANGAAVNANRVAVRGTVAPGNAAVQVAGQPAAVGNGVFAGTVSLQPGKNTIDVIGSAAGKSPATATIVITRTGAGGGSGSQGNGATSGQSSCGGGLSVGPNTSCPFAQNVENAYQANGGPGTFPVSSPVTGQTYTLTCNLNGSQVACTGGNNASVYFQASGQPQTNGQSSCGGGLSVGPNTSCSFAQNVENAYRGNGGPGTFQVSSPATGQTYSMTCNLSGSEVTCTGGNNASVYFPQ